MAYSTTEEEGHAQDSDSVDLAEAKIIKTDKAMITNNEVTLERNNRQASTKPDAKYQDAIE